MRKVEIRGAVLAVCAVAAARYLVGQASGSLKMRGQLKMILDILLAIAITAPFARGFAEFELPDITVYEQPDYSYAEAMADRALAQQTAENVCDILSEQLSAVGIDCGKISAEVNISQDGRISINRVAVITEDIGRAAELIRGTLGEETEVVNEGDQQAW